MSLLQHPLSLTPQEGVEAVFIERRRLGETLDILDDGGRDCVSHILVLARIVRRQFGLGPISAVEDKSFLGVRGGLGSLFLPEH